MVERVIEIDAPIGRVYEVIRDFSSYPDFLSTTHSAKELKTKNDSILVDFTIEVVKTIKYRLRFECDPPNSLRWDLEKGDLMKKNSGAWLLESLPDGRTRARYQIDVDFGWFVPKMILDQVTKIQLPQTLDAFKARAEAMKSV